MTAVDTRLRLAATLICRLGHGDDGRTAVLPEEGLEPKFVQLEHRSLIVELTVGR